MQVGDEGPGDQLFVVVGPHRNTTHRQLIAADHASETLFRGAKSHVAVHSVNERLGGIIRGTVSLGFSVTTGVAKIFGCQFPRGC